MTRARQKKGREASETEGVDSPDAVGWVGKRTSREVRDHDMALDRKELLGLVCQMFCSGLKAGEIRDKLRTDHGIKLNREAPYQLIARAASQGWIRYTPPTHFLFEQEIMERFHCLKGLNVVYAVTSEDVATCGSRMLLRMLQQYYANREVHIGFSGGHAMRKVARHLAELLREPAEALPSKIVLHALVSGFDLTDPTTDPNAFFTYFVGDQGLLVETEFVGLHAPPVISPEQLHSFINLESFKLARKHAERLDVVVTSASQVKDEHNALLQHMHISEKVLRKAGCIGDILWQPIGPNGPVQVSSGVRALTLIDLQELQGLVARGGHVLLVAGPCGTCQEPKAEVVEAILRQPQRLITHLVTDSRCAGALINRTGK